MTVTARSTSPFAAVLLNGPMKRGTAIGHGYVLFDEDVLAVTAPRALRMPNGIEANLALTTGERVTAGEGELHAGTATVCAGPLWDPRPRPQFTLTVRPHHWLRLENLAGWGPGLTPLGDDILVGYLAASALADAQTWIARMAARAGRRTTALSRTLLRLAAKGQLTEAAHLLLETGDPQPLLGFGATSGKGIALGLALAERAAGTLDSTIVVDLPLPRRGGRFKLSIAAL